MKITSTSLCVGIPTSLGEIINIKYHLDQVKNQYDQIKLSFHTDLWKDGLFTESSDWPHRKKLWDKLLFDLGQLFFNEPPYTLMPNSSQPYGGDVSMLVARLKMSPQKAEMAHLLCKGAALNLDGEYIVITTKIRQMEKSFFNSRSPQLWSILQRLSGKYKIVVLGEKHVEMRKEYIASNNSVFGIYDQIMANFPQDKLIDLTVPALGETVSDLSQIQQDCLIMHQAKFVITLGIGGNTCMAQSCANMVVGFRNDTSLFADHIYNKEYPNAIVTKNWNHFLDVLGRYL